MFGDTLTCGSSTDLVASMTSMAPMASMTSMTVHQLHPHQLHLSRGAMGTIAMGGAMGGAGGSPRVHDCWAAPVAAVVDPWPCCPRGSSCGPVAVPRAPNRPRAKRGCAAERRQVQLQFRSFLCLPACLPACLPVGLSLVDLLDVQRGVYIDEWRP